jgi:DNA-binding transcriptional LysR family regulator
MMNAFVAVVDGNGFARAARKLDVSPPVVTRAVSELETRLGVRLLNRTTRVVRVTEAGAQYARDCRRILASLVDADALLVDMNAAPRGVLTLTAPVLFGARFVTPIVTEFLGNHPEVTASCWFLDRMVNLVNEGVDVAVRIGELPDSSLQAVRVGSVRRIICGAPAYLARHGTPTTPECLAGHRLVSVGSPIPAPEWPTGVNGAMRAVKVQPRMTTNTNDSAVAAAVSGFGLTRLLSYQVADQLHAGELQIVLEAFEPKALPVHVVHREGRHASPRARTFLDLAIDRLRADPRLH